MKKSNVLWRPLKLEGTIVIYSVSNHGDVKCHAHTTLQKDGKYLTVQERILTPFQDRQGYLNVDINRTKFRVHRLVAENFITKIPDRDVVNHRDGDKSNNRVSNLEWSTPRENTKHAIDSGLRPRGRQPKPIAMFGLDGVYLKEFPSIKEASAITGINKRSIANCANGARNKAGEYKWSFV